MSKRIEQLDAFVTQKVFALQQANDLVAKQLLRGDGIDIRDRDPLSLGSPNPTRGQAVSVGVWVENTSKCWWDHNDSGTGVRIAGGFEHQLLDGLISKAGQITQKLSLAHEIRSEHLWKGKCPETMANVFQQLVFEKSSKGGG